MTETPQASDGIEIQYLDAHDAPAVLSGWSMRHASGLDPRSLIAILPWRFHGVQPGYLLITYDQRKDPRWEAP